jgi:hypothetical protein
MIMEMVAFMGNGDIRYSDIKEKLDAVRRMYPGAMWISNGSIGIPLMAAKYAMFNKIPLFICISFPHEIMLQGWRNILYEALKYAQRVSTCSDYRECNERIINYADVVVVFDRFNSDAIADCTRYADSAGKLVLDGFSLITPEAVGLHTGLWTYPAATVIAADRDACGEAAL